MMSYFKQFVFIIQTPWYIVFLRTVSLALTTAPLIDSVLDLCAAQFFCLVAMIAFGVDVFLQVRDIRRKFRERQPRNSRDVPVID